MTEPLVIHVAPIPPDHKPSPECWCEPICGMDAGDNTTTCVHRLGPTPIDMVLNQLAPSQWRADP